MFGHFVGLALKGLNSQCYSIIIRSSRPNVICKKGVLKNFSKFTGKHLFWSLFFAGLRPATLVKKRLWHRCFPVNFANFIRTPSFMEYLRWFVAINQCSRFHCDMHLHGFQIISFVYIYNRQLTSITIYRTNSYSSYVYSILNTLWSSAGRDR